MFVYAVQRKPRYDGCGMGGGDGDGDRAIVSDKKLKSGFISM